MECELPEKSPLVRALPIELQIPYPARCFLFSLPFRSCIAQLLKGSDVTLTTSDEYDLAGQCWNVIFRLESLATE